MYRLRVAAALGTVAGLLGCHAREHEKPVIVLHAVNGASEPLGVASNATFAPTIPNPGRPPGPAPVGMAWVPGGEFSMGGDETMPDARPIHRVFVDGFWLDRTEVTNAEFARFVRATHYRTVAERAPRPEDVPGAPPEKVMTGSVVFTPPAGPVPLDSEDRWWAYVGHASWRHPTGAGDGLLGRDNYPVVQVAYADAEAYARWAGKRLPTEAEFEFAARGGLAGRRYAWGDEERPAGRWMANTFQGHFPDEDSGEDGWRGVAPVASYPPNGYGLFDIAGNVWEWCSDWYRPDTYSSVAAAGAVSRNPAGPESSHDPAEPGVLKRVHRGGSFLCSATFCSRFLVGSRGRGEVTTATNHLGFRCARSPARSQQQTLR